MIQFVLTSMHVPGILFPRPHHPPGFFSASRVDSSPRFCVHNLFVFPRFSKSSEATEHGTRYELLSLSALVDNECAVDRQTEDPVISKERLFNRCNRFLVDLHTLKPCRPSMFYYPSNICYLNSKRTSHYNLNKKN